MHRAYIGLGSNLGDSQHILQRAWARIGEHPEIELVTLASPYLSEPVDMESENWFVNSAGCLRTTLDPPELLALLHETETQFGRERRATELGYRDRPLDLDLLLYDNLLSVEPGGLIIPHPRMHERLFVLLPLGEIAADRYHPMARRSIEELLTDLQNRPGQPEVRKIHWEKAV